MKINADLVKELRSSKQWSQEQLGDACGLSLRTIQRLEKTGNTSMESVRSLASVFDVDPDKLIFTEKDKSMTPLDAVKTGVLKYADFSGTATRFEYWWFFLFAFLMACSFMIINNGLYQVFHLLVAIPLLAAGARRLNEAGQSGWWQLLYLTGAGAVVVFYLQTLPEAGSAAPSQENG